MGSALIYLITKTMFLIAKLMIIESNKMLLIFKMCIFVTENLVFDSFVKKMDSGLPPTGCVYASRPSPGPSSLSSGFTHYQLFTLTLYFLPELCNMFLLVSLLFL